MIAKFQGFMASPLNRGYVAVVMALTAFAVGVARAGAQTTPLEDAEAAVEGLVADYTPVVIGVAVTVAGLSIALVLLRKGIRLIRGA